MGTSLNDLREQLVGEASSYGIVLSNQQVELLLRHLELVIDKNKMMNLTRITDPTSAVRLHIIDSLLLSHSLEKSDGMFLDIGTGAGFPGIPLSILSGRKGVLLDSVHKKIGAVDEFIEELGLSGSLTTSSMRVEDYARERRNEFGAVVARAVAPLNVLVEYAAPLLKKKGLLIVAKANIGDEETEDGIAAASICGLESVSRETYELPHRSGHREVLVLQKVRQSSVKLPRANGCAKKTPLG